MEEAKLELELELELELGNMLDDERLAAECNELETGLAEDELPALVPGVLLRLLTAALEGEGLTPDEPLPQALILNTITENNSVFIIFIDIP